MKIAAATCCFVCAMALLPGCATVRQPSEVAEPSKEGLESRLEEYANSVSKSFRQLAEMETRMGGASAGSIAQSSSPSKKDFKIPEPLKREVPFSWSGPIEGAIQKIANMAGYKLEVTGSEPTFPIIVSVSQSNVSLFDLLYDIGYQAGKTVDIVLKPAQKVVEVRYPKVVMKISPSGKGAN